jgi:hypothetical protein
MYISEKRLTGNYEEVDGIISPGSKTICHAMATISSMEQENTNHIHSQVKVKLDSCGSVSIAHSDYLIQVKPARLYGLQSIRLLGIGGKTNYLKEVGVLPVKKDDDGVCFMLCYVFNTPLGDTNKIDFTR